MLAKVTATPAALELMAEIVTDHGPVLFHQSGGCCDGSSPMCCPVAGFIIGDQDVLLGHIGEAPFYIGASQGGWSRRHVLAGQRAGEAIPDAVDHLRCQMRM